MDETVKKRLAELKKTRAAEPKKPKEPETKRSVCFVDGVKKSEIMLDSKQRAKLDKFVDKLLDPPKPRTTKVTVADDQ